MTFERSLIHQVRVLLTTTLTHSPILVPNLNLTQGVIRLNSEQVNQDFRLKVVERTVNTDDTAADLAIDDLTLTAIFGFVKYLDSERISRVGIV